MARGDRNNAFLGIAGIIGSVGGGVLVSLVHGIFLYALALGLCAASVYLVVAVVVGLPPASRAKRHIVTRQPRDHAPVVIAPISAPRTTESSAEDKTIRDRLVDEFNAGDMLRRRFPDPFGTRGWVSRIQGVLPPSDLDVSRWEHGVERLLQSSPLLAERFRAAVADAPEAEATTRPVDLLVQRVERGMRALDAIIREMD